MGSLDFPFVKLIEFIVKVQSDVISRQEPNKLFVYLTCLYIITWYLQVGERIAWLGAIRFEFILGSILSVCALMTYFASDQKNSPLFGPVVLFFGILTCYTLFSYNFNYSWDIYFNRVVKFSMLAVFLSVFIRTPWALKMAIGAFLLAMLKLGQEGFVGWLTGDLVWENQGIQRLHGSVPIYRHPNSFSGMAVGCLPFIYYLFPNVSKLWRFLLLLLLMFCVVIIVFTGSRTGYVATLGLGFVFFVKSRGIGRWRNLFIVILVVLAGALFAPTDYTHRFQSIFTLQEREGASSETRIEIIKDAVAVYSAYPFGVGVGTFPLVRYEMFGRSQDTHNLYLELLTNLGPLGLLSFLYMIYTIIKINNNIIFNLSNANVDQNDLLYSVSRAIISFIYARIFLGLFGMDTYEIYWWFAVGITSSVYTIYYKDYGNLQWKK